MYTKAIGLDYLPQVIILSTQRSGTHLLLSFLNKHPQINGRGEIFLKFNREGVIERNHTGKTNVGIVMYYHLHILNKFKRDLLDYKIIHLLRNPYDVALSQLQMMADKKIMGDKYRAHYHENKIAPLSKGIPDLLGLDALKTRLEQEQKYFKSRLIGTPHCEVNYEEIAPDNKNVKYLNMNVCARLCDFLGLEMDATTKLYTTIVKTGINN